METPASIREFWFGAQADDAAVAAEKSKLWWAKDDATDALMRQRFDSVLSLAAGGALDRLGRHAGRAPGADPAYGSIPEKHVSRYCAGVCL